MNFIATKIYQLEGNKDLLPGRGILPTDSNPIQAIHCIMQPTSEVVIRTATGQVINFPHNSFVQGAIYPYSIRQVNDEGSRCFVGLSN